jgi:hypothetical protein
VRTRLIKSYPKEANHPPMTRLSAEIGASPLRTRLRTQHESFPLTALKPYFKRSTWILNVPVCDMHDAGAEGFRPNYLRLEQQELYGGCQFPLH